jgi:hypothetical protein
MAIVTAHSTFARCFIRFSVTSLGGGGGRSLQRGLALRGQHREQGSHQTFLLGYKPKCFRYSVITIAATMTKIMCVE